MGHVAVYAYWWVQVGWTHLNGLDDLDDTSPIGRAYEVDISYPVSLHDAYSDLPFLPEISIPISSKVQKLMVTLETKNNYIIHYRNLKQAIAYGLIVEKVNILFLLFEMSILNINKYILLIFFSF